MYRKEGLGSSGCQGLGCLDTHNLGRLKHSFPISCRLFLLCFIDISVHSHRPTASSLGRLEQSPFATKPTSRSYCAGCRILNRSLDLENVVEAPASNDLIRRSKRTRVPRLKQFKQITLRVQAPDSLHMHHFGKILKEI